MERKAAGSLLCTCINLGLCFRDVHNGKTRMMIGNHSINNTWEYKLFRVLQFTIDLINQRTGGPRRQWEQSVRGKEVKVFLEFRPFVNLEKVLIEITCYKGVWITFGNVWYDRLQLATKLSHSIIVIIVSRWSINVPNRRIAAWAFTININKKTIPKLVSW